MSDSAPITLHRGDVVQLRSGGAKMTVRYLSEIPPQHSLLETAQNIAASYLSQSAAAKSEDKGYICVWHDGEGKLQTAAFHLEELVLVDTRSIATT